MIGSGISAEKFPENSGSPACLSPKNPYRRQAHADQESNADPEDKSLEAGWPLRKSPADIRSKFPTEEATPTTASSLIPSIAEEIGLTVTAAGIQGDPGTPQTSLLQRLEENRCEIQSVTGDRFRGSRERRNRLQNL